jgi:TRAP-type C4-dicarboxylate transport system permease small subunit
LTFTTVKESIKKGEIVMIVLRIASMVNKFTERVACVLMVLMVLSAILQVVGRFVFSQGYGWTEELSRYLFIWCVFLGSSIAMHYNAHLGIEALIKHFSPEWRKIIAWISCILCLILFAHMIGYGCKMLPIIGRQTSPGLGVSMAWPYSGIVIGGALMALHTVAEMIRLKSAKEEGK